MRFVYNIILDLEFTEDSNITLKEINKFMNSCGFPEKLVAKSKMTVGKLTAKKELTVRQIKKIELRFLEMAQKNFKAANVLDVNIVHTM